MLVGDPCRTPFMISKVCFLSEEGTITRKGAIRMVQENTFKIYYYSIYSSRVVVNSPPWVGRVGIIWRSLYLELLLIARRGPLMLRTVPISWESRIFPKKDSRNLLCALVEKEDLRVSCLRKMLLGKCNVAPILSRLLTQQEGNVFFPTRKFTSLFHPSYLSSYNLSYEFSNKEDCCPPHANCFEVENFMKQQHCGWLQVIFRLETDIGSNSSENR